MLLLEIAIAASSLVKVRSSLNLSFPRRRGGVDIKESVSRIAQEHF
jgi:hypothetical protein